MEVPSERGLGLFANLVPRLGVWHHLYHTTLQETWQGDREREIHSNFITPHWEEYGHGERERESSVTLSSQEECGCTTYNEIYVGHSEIM